MRVRAEGLELSLQYKLLISAESAEFLITAVSLSCLQARVVNEI